MLASALASCGSGGSNLPVKYSRDVNLLRVSDSEVRPLLQQVANATATSEADVQKSVDGELMYLYANDDVVIFARKTYGVPCVEDMCAWTLTVTADKGSLPDTVQQQIVDRAVGALGGIEYVREHLP